MKTRKTFRKWLLCCGAVSSALLLPTFSVAQPKDDGDNKIEPGEQIVVTKPDAKMQHSPTTNSHTAPPPGSDERADMKMQNPRFVVDTISEEKTEIAALKAQSAQLRKLGGSKNRKIAALLDRMRREHEAASPAMITLAKSLGGDPSRAKIMKEPMLGSPGEMLHATHMDHGKAVQTSQMRWGMTNNAKVRAAMHKRGNLARKHMRWMTPYHNAKNCPMCGSMMSAKACPACADKSCPVCAGKGCKMCGGKGCSMCAAKGCPMCAAKMKNGTMMKDGMNHNTHGMKTM